MDFSQNVAADFSSATNHAYYTLTIGAKAVLKLIQFIARMHEANLLDKKQIDSLKAFTKVTKGDFSIQNIPIPKEGDITVQSDQISKELRELGIRFHQLPNINSTNHSLQFCVFNEDKQKFSIFMESYIKNALSGGEKTADDIKNFTNGKFSIVSLDDRAVEKMTDVMTSLNISYSKLPDLNLKDGETQFFVPNVHLESLKEAYKLYRDGLLKQNVEINDMKNMTMAEYSDTGKITEDEYINSADSSVKDKVNALPTEDNEVTSAISSLEPEIRNSSDYACKEFLTNPKFSQLSIDAQTLVDSVPLVKSLSGQFPDSFFCRVPGTYKDKIQILQIPKEQVFDMNEPRKRFTAFIAKDEPPLVYMANKQPCTAYASGEELYKHFSKAHSKSKAMTPIAAEKTKEKLRDYTADDFAKLEADLVKLEESKSPEQVVEKVAEAAPKMM